MSLLFAALGETINFVQAKIFALVYSSSSSKSIVLHYPRILANPVGTLVLFSKTTVLTAQVYLGGVV